MPRMAWTGSLAAGATVSVLSGWTYEYLPFNAKIAIAVGASATGIVGTISSGSDVLQEESPVQLGLTAFPTIYNTEYLYDDAAAGDRLQVKLRNTTGGALTYYVSVQVTPA